LLYNKIVNDEGSVEEDGGVVYNGVNCKEGGCGDEESGAYKEQIARVLVLTIAYVG